MIRCRKKPRQDSNETVGGYRVTQLPVNAPDFRKRHTCYFVHRNTRAVGGDYRYGGEWSGRQSVCSAEESRFFHAARGVMASSVPVRALLDGRGRSSSPESEHHYVARFSSIFEGVCPRLSLISRRSALGVFQAPMFFVKRGVCYLKRQPLLHKSFERLPGSVIRIEAVIF